jgi:hypothetical protein
MLAPHATGTHSTAVINILAGEGGTADSFITSGIYERFIPTMATSNQP